ncbi:hypothetical protein HBI56_102600 [Parastagonospora nodorum]|nr:hypothetical protein HBH56_136260 [Parastagonospora nodorum]KAH3927115.1 hypothetical protein HBH54_157030 [Parastagonospora nodorum]KAH3956520.1 hypothetical protein HBH51_240870 [Parastagonospora nodorum]KAH4144191.1 hypothetical protein HBH45_022800 [Parastagonospora nodorum]KAH4158734.1 hypothetical protein HBH44_108470 [Parastagonospora nodorum]
MIDWSLWEEANEERIVKDTKRRTLIACVCVDGTVLRLGLIYKSSNISITSDWVAEIEPGKHSVMVTCLIAIQGIGHDESGGY